MPDAMLCTECPPMARWLLRGDPAAFTLELPRTPCRALPGPPDALWLGPDEWLVLAAEGWRPDCDAGRGSAVDIGHRQLGLLLEGAAAAEVLAAGCPLDLHPSAFPPGMCTRTVFGKAEIVLWRQDAARFHLEVWRSFAPYVRGLLAAARLGGPAGSAGSCT